MGLSTVVYIDVEHERLDLVHQNTLGDIFEGHISEYFKTNNSTKQIELKLHAEDLVMRPFAGFAS